MKVRLGDYIEQIRGVSYSPADLHSALNEKSVILLRANNINDNKINFDDVVFVDKNKVSKNQYLQEGDILVCTSSGSKHLVGKAAYVDKAHPVTFGAFCKIVRPKTSIKRYIGYFFESPFYRTRISELSGGANINNIRNEHIDELVLELPEESIQNNICLKLNKISILIEKRKQQLEKLDLLVKSKFIEMFGDPIVNEKGWAAGKLSDVAELKIGPFGSVLHKDDYVVGGHALINPSHIVNGKIVPDTALTLSDDKYNELSAYQLKENDIVLGRRGEMGRCAVVHEKGLFCGTGSMIVRPNGKIHSYFLQSVLSSSSMKILIEERAVGVTMANLNVPIVANLPIPIYPMAKQKEYIELLQLTDKTKLKIKQSLEKFDILKKALMQKYFG